MRFPPFLLVAYGPAIVFAGRVARADPRKPGTVSPFRFASARVSFTHVDGSISMCVKVHPKFGVKPIAPPSRPGTDIPTTGDVVMAAGICMLIAGSVMFVAGHLLASRRGDV